MLRLCPFQCSPEITEILEFNTISICDVTLCTQQGCWHISLIEDFNNNPQSVRQT
jgi:hypothetical protein